MALPTQERFVATASRHLVRALLLASMAITPIGATAPQPAAAALPLAGVVIALDPGHNGGNASHLSTINRLVFVGNGWKACNTVGTSTRTGYAEHAFNFAWPRASGRGSRPWERPST
jgi:N-acetylmuramoyl-L-alanine amidase